MKTLSAFIDRLAKVPTWVWAAIVIVIAAGYRVWFLYQPALVWWDEAIYIGTGKFIFSGGVIGAFEVFRPLVWPFVLGTLWKLGIDPHDAGQVIVSVASLCAIWMAYLVGERLQRYAGAVAAVLLASSTLFFTYSKIPVTDVLSATISLVAIWLALKERWFWSGLVAGLVFQVRFPHVLVFASICAYLVLLAAMEGAWKKRFHDALAALGGFAIFAVPFFVGSWFAYGDPLLPLRLGRGVVNFSDSTYDYLFYAKQIVAQWWPFYLGFAMLPLLIFAKKLRLNRGAWLVAIALVVLGVYFSRVPHKEDRYTLAFLSYAAILSAYLIAWIFARIGWKWLSFAFAVWLAWSFWGNQKSIRWQHVPNAPALAPYERFQDFFKGMPAGTHVVTSYPMIAGTSDVRVDEIVDSWENALDAYNRRGSKPDYYMLNTCLLPACTTLRCANAKSELVTRLESEQTNVLAESTAEGCNLKVYKTRR